MADSVVPLSQSLSQMQQRVNQVSANVTQEQDKQTTRLAVKKSFAHLRQQLSDCEERMLDELEGRQTERVNKLSGLRAQLDGLCAPGADMHNMPLPILTQMITPAQLKQMDDCLDSISHLRVHNCALYQQLEQQFTQPILFIQSTALLPANIQLSLHTATLLPSTPVLLKMTSSLPVAHSAVQAHLTIRVIDALLENVPYTRVHVQHDNQSIQHKQWPLIQFTPHVPGAYTVNVQLYEQAVSNSPLRLNVTIPKQNVSQCDLSVNGPMTRMNISAPSVMAPRIMNMGMGVRQRHMFNGAIQKMNSMTLNGAGDTNMNVNNHSTAAGAGHSVQQSITAVNNSYRNAIDNSIELTNTNGVAYGFEQNNTGNRSETETPDAEVLLDEENVNDVCSQSASMPLNPTGQSASSTHSNRPQSPDHNVTGSNAHNGDVLHFEQYNRNMQMQGGAQTQTSLAHAHTQRTRVLHIDNQQPPALPASYIQQPGHARVPLMPAGRGFMAGALGGGQSSTGMMTGASANASASAAPVLPNANHLLVKAVMQRPDLAQLITNGNKLIMQRLIMFGQPGQSGNMDNNFCRPIGCSQNVNNKDLLICDTDHDVVKVYSSNGEPRKMIRLPDDGLNVGGPQRTLKRPSGIVCLPGADLLCVKDDQGIFTCNYESLRDLQLIYQTYMPFGFCAAVQHGKECVITICQPRTITFIDPMKGRKLHEFKYIKAHDSQAKPRFLDWHPHELIAISDLGVNSVFLCSALDGSLLREFTAARCGFNFPSGVSFDCNQNLLVGDAKNNRVLVLSGESDECLGAVHFTPGKDSTQTRDYFPFPSDLCLMMGPQAKLMVMSRSQHYAQLYSSV